MTVQIATLLLLVSILAFIAQIVMTWGYRYVHATKGSIMSYAGIPITIILSAIFNNEVFKLRFFIGMALILLGLLINALWKNSIESSSALKQ